MTEHIIALGQTFSGSEFWNMRREMFPHIVVIDYGPWDPSAVAEVLVDMGLKQTGHAVAYEEAGGIRYVCDGDFVMAGTVVWFKDEAVAVAAKLFFT